MAKKSASASSEPKTKKKPAPKKMDAPRPEAYKMGGKACKPEAPECLAKVVIGVGGTKLFYVKCGSAASGVFGGCNPNEMGFKANYLNGRDPVSGKRYYEFRSVGIIGWGIYMKFLQTGNPGLLNEFVRAEGL